MINAIHSDKIVIPYYFAQRSAIVYLTYLTFLQLFAFFDISVNDIIQYVLNLVIITRGPNMITVKKSADSKIPQVRDYWPRHQLAMYGSLLFYDKIISNEFPSSV